MISLRISLYDSMSKSPTRITTFVILPFVFLGSFQLIGCANKEQAIPSGGTYISTSGGAQFDQSVILEAEEEDLTNHIANINFSELVRSPNNPQKIYAVARRRGIYVSENEGKNWKAINHPLASVESIAELANHIIIISGSSNNGDGVVMRSLDQAKSWEKILTVPASKEEKKQKIEFIKAPDPQPIYVSHLKIDPFNNEHVYAITNTGNLLSGEQSGKTWNRLPYDKGPVKKMEVSPHREGEIFLLTRRGELIRFFEDEQEKLNPRHQRLTLLDFTLIKQFPEAIVIGTNFGASATSDGGKTWIDLRLPISTSTPIISSIVSVSPTNPSRIFVAVHNIFYRSEDGGKTWNSLALPTPNHIITDISINPNNASRVIISTTLNKA